MKIVKAFTLIELLVVIAIVGILSGFAVVQMNGAINTANDAKKKTNLDSIKKALVMYSVENGERYPEEDGCVIGSCSTLDTALEPFLPTDTEGSFVYQSDGSSFTISSVLSSGYSYEYDSSTGIYSTNTPINGVCGTSNTANLSSIPTTNLCTTGTASVVGGSGPWTWSCSGAEGGTTASCSTGSVPTNGNCGSSNNQNLSSIPSTNLCTNGTPSTVSGSGPWTWSCSGTNTGTNDSCSANLITNGSCGTANKTYTYDITTYGSDTICAAGTANPTTPDFPTAGGSTNWTCVGLNTGTTANCTASRNNTPINGACGSSHNSNFYSIPTTNLCTSGTASSVSGSGPWSWTCAGLYSGTTANCSANLSVNGVCGSKNSKYATSTPTGTQACTTGSITGMTGSYSWSCAGTNGGTSPSCATVAATYTVVPFTTVGTTSWTVPTGVTSVEYLVVAGGASGAQAGDRGAGGGGAGGYRNSCSGEITGGGGSAESPLATTPGQNLTVTVGAGGVYSSPNSGNGGDSVFGSIIAIGGGGGTSESQSVSTFVAGSSGGGGCGLSGCSNPGVGPISSSPTQGYIGGTGGTYVGGGGGGAGGVGVVSSSTGNGGPGLSSSITGVAVWRGGGGGGAGSSQCSSGGIGGGGGGKTSSCGYNGENGTANTGGGGGATGWNGTKGNGGSGVVIVRYINNY
jgi:prepilin-type N-terminal cleavage/methylation domain-containing protein